MSTDAPEIVTGKPPVWPTRPTQMKFEARRLHNLLLFVEHARTQEERAAASESVFRSLRQHLTGFYDLEARPRARCNHTSP